MACIPSYRAIRSKFKVVSINGCAKLDNSFEDVVEIVKLLLCGVEFDESWYLARYPDVAGAVKKGLFRSGRHHFVEAGYFEGRWPKDIEVDEQWYVGTYPDVAEGIQEGKVASARQHFSDHGYDEGRFPAAP